MNREIIKRTNAYKVEIFIGTGAKGYDGALNTCLAYCTEVGLCVTVDPTQYVYRSGHEPGVRVGLINYARFPTDQRILWNTACDLAEFLKEALGQGSYTVQDHEISEFVSTRNEDQ